MVAWGTLTGRELVNKGQRLLVRRHLGGESCVCEQLKMRQRLFLYHT
jgi:hypothetical protein